MSNTLTTNMNIYFDTAVKHAYDEGGTGLSRFIRNNGTMIGGKVRFRLMGKGMARQRTAPAEMRQPMNVNHSYTEGTLVDYEAVEFTDKFDQAEVDYSEMDQLASVVAGAIEKRKDQLVIDALDAASTSNTVGTDIGGTASGLNVDKLREAKLQLDNHGVGAGDRVFVSSAQGESDLLGETEVGSADYNQVRALVNGEVSRFMGFNFVFIPASRDDDEGGLPTTTNTRKHYAFEGQALGMRAALDGAAKITYENLVGSWLIAQDLKAVCKHIDPDGIVEITTTETGVGA